MVTLPTYITTYPDFEIHTNILCFSRGRWHGDVDIHSYKAPDEQGRREFWEMASKLHRARHDNIAMFMGAIVEQEFFSIVLW